MTTNQTTAVLRSVSIAMLLSPVFTVVACRAPSQDARAGSAAEDTRANAGHSGGEATAAQATPHADRGAGTDAKEAAPADRNGTDRDLADRKSADRKPTAEPTPFELTVPGTTVRLEMKPVPAGSIEVPDTTRPGTTTRVDVPALWFSSSEITWDMYDSFVFAMDRAETEKDPPDAWTRPSKPYILMDRGFGHTGYPAISVSHKGATEFCKWLSSKTGRRFRLPTEVEWEHAATVGLSGASLPADLDAYAWHAGNSEFEMRLTTHPVKQKKADASGLHDMLGNASEWTVGADGKGVARGGSFKDPAEQTSPRTRRPDDRSLNKTDPQVPKSVWWLADGGFIGFRVVCEPPTKP